MPRAQTLCDLSPYLSLHISVCALVSACCSFLPSFSQHLSCGTEDSPTRPSVPSTRVRAHARARAARVISWAGRPARPLPPASGPNNPVRSRPRAQVRALRASTTCARSPLVSERRGGAILEAIESDLIPTLAFCQQRLHSDERDGSPAPASLLFYVSCRQTENVKRQELCFPCQEQV